MKYIKADMTAFGVCIALSLLICTFLLLNVKAIAKYTHMVDAGKQILESVSEMQLQEKNYLLDNHRNVLEKVKDKISNSRNLLSFYEKSKLAEDRGEPSGLADWEEAMSLYERLFDQFILYHEAVQKNVAAIRDLEKSILSVIYSKMNPERGIIGLQEIRIHEKGYLLSRSHPALPDKRSFQAMRREAVSNLLMWAGKDKRIEELMDKDNQLFNEIITNDENQDDTLLALERERERIRNISKTFLEQGNRRLRITHRRCLFLCITLLIMWLIMAVAIVVTRFAHKPATKDIGIA
jgi:hypothetical protein